MSFCCEWISPIPPLLLVHLTHVIVVWSHNCVSTYTMTFQWVVVPFLPFPWREKTLMPCCTVIVFKSPLHLLTLSLLHALAQSMLLAHYKSQAYVTLQHPCTQALPRTLAHTGSLILSQHDTMQLTSKLFQRHARSQHHWCARHLLGRGKSACAIWSRQGVLWDRRACQGTQWTHHWGEGSGAFSCLQYWDMIWWLRPVARDLLTVGCDAWTPEQYCDGAHFKVLLFIKYQQDITYKFLMWYKGLKWVDKYIKVYKSYQAQLAAPGLTSEEHETLLLDKEREKQDLKLYKTVEHVVSHRDGAKGEIEYFCKWNGLNYEHCIWKPLEETLFGIALALYSKLHFHLVGFLTQTTAITVHTPSLPYSTLLRISVISSNTLLWSHNIISVRSVPSCNDPNSLTWPQDGPPCLAPLLWACLRPHQPCHSPLCGGLGTILWAHMHQPLYPHFQRHYHVWPQCRCCLPHRCRMSGSAGIWPNEGQADSDELMDLFSQLVIKQQALVVERNTLISQIQSLLGFKTYIGTALAHKVTSISHGSLSSMALMQQARTSMELPPSSFCVPCALLNTTLIMTTTTTREKKRSGS